MNLIKGLEKQVADGKNLVAENGEVFGAEKLQKKALKEYNLLVKKGEVNPMKVSCKEFFYDSFEDYLTVEEIISFIKQPFEAESDPEEKEIHTEVPNVVPAEAEN